MDLQVQDTMKTTKDTKLYNRINKVSCIRRQISVPHTCKSLQGFQYRFLALGMRQVKAQIAGQKHGHRLAS